MKHIIIYLFCFFVVFANEKYTPKNTDEKKVLEKYREKKLKVGFLDNFFFEIKSKNNKSSNDTLDEMLSKYLGLNIEIVKGDWPTLYGKFLNKEIDVLPRISRHSKHNGDFVFSIPVVDEKLYLVTNKDIDFPDYFKDISGKKVYLQNSSEHNKHFFNYLLKNDQKPEIKYVDKKFDYKDELILVTTQKLPYFKYNYEISDTPPTAFGLQKEYEDLVPILNNALKDRYINEFLKLNSYKNNSNYLDNFLNSLTEEELEYIENSNGVNVISSDSLIKSYSMNGSYVYLNGPLVLFNLLSKKTDLKFNKLNKKHESWSKTYEDLLNGEIDILFLAKTKERAKDLSFTKPIDEITLYKVTNLKSKSDKIGVMKGMIEYFRTKGEVKEAVKREVLKVDFYMIIIILI